MTFLYKRLALTTLGFALVLPAATTYAQDTGKTLGGGVSSGKIMTRS